MADNDSFVATTSQGTKRMSLSLLKQVFGKLFAPAPLSKNLTLYVNAATGSDSNDGLDAGRAKRTVAAALSLVPKDLGLRLVIINAIGVFDETVNLRSFENGIIELVGDGSTQINRGINVSACTAPIKLKSINLSGNGLDQVVGITYSTYVSLSSCNIDAAAALNKYGVTVNDGGFIYIYDVSVNHAERALVCGSGIMDVRNVTGADNEIGLIAGNPSGGAAGIILATSSNLGATTEIAKHFGGVVFKEGVLV